MSNKTLKPNASTQDHLDVQDIADDLVVLKTGWVALVMSTTAVNFDLLSEAEQDATIYAYGAFLNSLSFPVETLIRNKKADITAYFQSLEEAETSQPNPDLKRQIQKYEEFLQSIVQQKTVLDKKFYLIVNYSPLEGGFKNSGKVGTNTPKGTAQLLDAAKASLAPKRDHIIKQTARLGLVTKQLLTQELIELFYDIYNPAPTGTQRVILDSSSYTTPIVEPAIENPSAAPAPIPGATPIPKASPAHLAGGTAGVVAPSGNLGNLRPVPPSPLPIINTTSQFGGNSTPVAITAQSPMPSQPQSASTPYPSSQLPYSAQPPSQPYNPTGPAVGLQTPVTPSASMGTGIGQSQALRDLQEASAKAAQLLQSVNASLQPVASPQPPAQTYPPQNGDNDGGAR